MVQTSSTAGLDYIKKASANIEASGLTMVHPQGNLPKIVLYDMSKGEPAGPRAIYGKHNRYVNALPRVLP